MKGIVDEIRSRLDWIGVDWVEEEESSDDEDKNEGGTSSSKVVDDPSQTSNSKKELRVFDYACGTGLITRVCFPIPYSLHKSINTNDNVISMLALLSIYLQGL